jgi:hypothetical protein
MLSDRFAENVRNPVSPPPQTTNQTQGHHSGALLLTQAQTTRLPQQEYRMDMSQEEIRSFVQGCFKERIGRRAHVPLELTEEELTSLIESAPLALVMESMSRFGIWLTHKTEEGRRINRAQTLKGLRTVIKSRLNEQRDKTQPVPSTKPNGPPQEHVEELRQAFQVTVGELHSDPFTLTEAEVMELVHAHSAEELRAAFSDIATWLKTQDPEPTQQAVVDQLMWVLAQQHQFEEATQ